jgi:hypothetical protein
MRETSTQRSRRHRWRKRNGIAAVMVNVELRKLVAAGLISECSSSKQKIAAAVEALVKTATNGADHAPARS